MWTSEKNEFLLFFDSGTVTSGITLVSRGTSCEWSGSGYKFRLEWPEASVRKYIPKTFRPAYRAGKTRKNKVPRKKKTGEKILAYGLSLDGMVQVLTCQSDQCYFL